MARTGGISRMSYLPFVGVKPPRASVVFMVLTLLILLAPLLAPHDPYQTHILQRLQSPNLTYPLGTDAMGRCVLSRLLYGARLTTFSAVLVVVAAGGIGGILGAISGYFGGFFDRVLMRICEGVSVMPALAIAMVVAGVLGLGLNAVIVALVAVHWTDYARLVRNVVMAERVKPYVMAAEALGVPATRIIQRHLLFNIAGPLLALGAYSLSWVILSFAGLSFLGFGVEPGAPEWGRMIAESRSHLREYPRLVLAPGLTIMAFVITINLLGDVIGDRLRGGRANHLTVKE